MTTRYYTPVDALLVTLDQALRTVVVPPATTGRANPAVAARLLPRMLARTPDERRVYEAYLLHLRDRDAGEYARLRAEAEQKFPGAALP